MPARSHGSSRFLSGANKVSTTQSDVTSNVAHPGICRRFQRQRFLLLAVNQEARNRAPPRVGTEVGEREVCLLFRSIASQQSRKLVVFRSSIFNTCMHQKHLRMLGFGNCSLVPRAAPASLCADSSCLMKDDAWASRAPMEDHNDGEAKRDLLRANLDVQQLKVRNSRRAKWLVAVPRMS
jgi:hypothetical protein